MRKTTADDVTPLYSPSRAAAVTPHDTNPLANYKDIVTLYVGTGGQLDVKYPDGTSLSYANIPDGTWMDMAPMLILTSSTAGDIIAHYRQI